MIGNNAIRTVGVKETQEKIKELRTLLSGTGVLIKFEWGRYHRAKGQEDDNALITDMTGIEFDKLI